MSYLNSDDIIVFPATSRADAYQKDARLLTEESMVRMLRLLRSNDSYVISTLSEANSNNKLELLIAGYYIKVAFQSIRSATGISSGEYSLYAIITLSENSAGYVNIVGEDNGSDEYTGVNFQTEVPESDTISLFVGTISCSNNVLTLTSIGTPPLIDAGDYQ